MIPARNAANTTFRTQYRRTTVLAIRGVYSSRRKWRVYGLHKASRYFDWQLYAKLCRRKHLWRTSN